MEGRKTEVQSLPVNGDERVEVLVNSCISKVGRIELTIEGDERVEVLVNSCISKVGRIQ